MLAVIEDVDCFRGELLVHKQDGGSGEEWVREALLLHLWPTCDCPHDGTRDVVPAQSMAVDDFAHMLRHVGEVDGEALHASLELSSILLVEADQSDAPDTTDTPESVERSPELIAEATDVVGLPAGVHVFTQSSVPAEVDREALQLVAARRETSSQLSDQPNVSVPGAGEGLGDASIVQLDDLVVS